AFMTRLFILFLTLASPTLFAGSMAHSQPADKRFLPMSEDLIALNSREGRRLLRESEADEAYWQLSQFYAPQPDLGSCSVASCIIVLNALPIERPRSSLHGTYKV